VVLDGFWIDRTEGDERAARAVRGGGSLPEGASPYGALDLAGNVWEWTADTYDSNYHAESPADNPPGPPVSVNWRVVRGGSWNTAASAVRAANRFWSFPRRDYFDGFRCASS